MEQRSSLAITTLLCAALLGGEGAAADQPKRAAAATSAKMAASKLVETARWKAKLPANWRLARRCFDADATAPSEWTFTSKNRNVVFRVKLAADRGQKFEKLADRTIARLNDSMRSGEVLKKDTLKDDGRDIFYVMMKGFMVRNSGPKPYLTYRLLSRSPAHKSLATLTLSASAERVELFTQLVEALMEGFELKPAAAAKGGKK